MFQPGIPVLNGHTRSHPQLHTWSLLPQQRVSLTTVESWLDACCDDVQVGRSDDVGDGWIRHHAVVRWRQGHCVSERVVGRQSVGDRRVHCLADSCNGAGVSGRLCQQQKNTVQVGSYVFQVNTLPDGHFQTMRMRAAQANPSVQLSQVVCFMCSA